MTSPSSPGSAFGRPSRPPADSAQAPGRTAGPSAAPDGRTGRPGGAPGGSWAFVTTVVCDIALPVGLFYLLRELGLGETAALLLSGVVPAVHTLYSVLRRRKVDALGVFTLTLLVVSAAASLLTADPRIILARGSLLTALAGLWLLVTLFTARPFTYQALRSLLPGRSERLETLWTGDHSFRRLWRVLTVVWGTGLLVDAVIRLIMAYTLPVDSVPALDAVLYAVTWIVLQAITQVSLYRTGTFRKILQP
ncbi:VC0807 family protein [Streptomyces sp. NPDC026672]|uniref:VC0807 family protein n=1 Tax=unclassified Streptomyces TaxID=2593676 RepID=UPI0033E6A860